MSRTPIKPAVAIFLHEPLVLPHKPKKEDTISLNQQNLRLLKTMGIQHVALVPLCLHVVSLYDAPSAPPLGSVMKKQLGGIKKQLEQNRFNLIDKYTQLFDSASFTSDYYKKIHDAFREDEQNKAQPYRYLCVDNRDNLTVHSLKALRLKVACENYLNHLSQSPNKKLTDQKKSIVQDLLKLTKIATVESIQNFKKLLAEKKPELEARRDSATELFLKILLTILSLGIAIPLGLWRKEGVQTVKECEETLTLSC